MPLLRSTQAIYKSTLWQFEHIAMAWYKLKIEMPAAAKNTQTDRENVQRTTSRKPTYLRLAILYPFERHIRCLESFANDPSVLSKHGLAIEGIIAMTRVTGRSPLTATSLRAANPNAGREWVA